MTPASFQPEADAETLRDDAVDSDPRRARSTSDDATSEDCEVVVDCRIDSIHYGSFRAVADTHIPIHRSEITAFIGPSGCGKSTVLKSLNRMNDLVRGFRLDGRVDYQGQDIYGPTVDPVVLRRHIGMVFQQPNPFEMSIRENVAFGLRIQRFPGDVDVQIEKALRGAALWDEVKDKLDKNGLELSGGQQQRLCIARTIATEPEVILMDEPCSALDPIATRRIEELMLELKDEYTIAIVTHNLQQAARIADRTAFLYVSDERTGYLVEYEETGEFFENPKTPESKQYLAGEFS